MAVAFYDDITTVSDICVMAVSRLRVENEAPGDTVSDVLWRDSHIQKERERGRVGGRVDDRAGINVQE